MNTEREAYKLDLCWLLRLTVVTLPVLYNKSIPPCGRKAGSSLSLNLKPQTGLCPHSAAHCCHLRICWQAAFFMATSGSFGLKLMSSSTKVRWFLPTWLFAHCRLKSSPIATWSPGGAGAASPQHQLGDHPHPCPCTGLASSRSGSRSSCPSWASLHTPQAPQKAQSSSLCHLIPSRRMTGFQEWHY